MCFVEHRLPLAKKVNGVDQDESRIVCHRAGWQKVFKFLIGLLAHPVVDVFPCSRRICKKVHAFQFRIVVALRDVQEGRLKWSVILAEELVDDRYRDLVALGVVWSCEEQA